MLPPPPKSTLFPYTTLFRSSQQHKDPVLLQQAWESALRDGYKAAKLPPRSALSDRKSTRLNSSHQIISYAVFCLKKKKKKKTNNGNQQINTKHTPLHHRNNS